MASVDNKELEKKLVEAGNKLLQLPSSVDEILFLLDQVENSLSKVEQSPSQSMQIAISPSMKALVADELLRHRDADVKVAVASCISEITRITAPDAPYDDDQMKDIFQLIVSSFENLSDMASRSYDKRTMILETVAKVRSCVVMLDLECDGLIVEMFEYFLKAIRDDHPDNVFSSMETIMTLVLEESEDISLELISPILATVKSDNQEVLPIARKLAERVVENSVTKLKPYLVHATKILGFSVDDYSKAISSIFSGTTGALGRNDRSACVEQSTKESNLARASSDVAVQDENKLAVASPDETAQVQPTKDSFPETRAEGAHPADDRSLKSVVSNGVTEAGYVDRTADRESSKEKKLEQEQLQEQAHQTDQPVGANVTINGEPADSNSGKTIKSDSRTEKTSKKRRRKKSVNNSTEYHDSSRVDSDKKAETTEHHGKSLSKEVHSSPSGEPLAEVPVPREIEKKDVHMLSPKELGSKEMDAASPSSSGNLPAEGRSKKAGRAKKNDDLTRGVATSADVFKKASGGTGGLEGKKQRRSGKKATAGRTNEEKTSSLEEKSKKRSGRKATAGRNTDVKTPALEDKSKSEDVSTSDSENKPLKLCVRKVDARENIGDGSSSKKKEDGKRRIRGKSISKSNSIQSTKDDDKEMVSSPKPALNLAKVEDHLEDTPKISSKRKRVPVKEKTSDALEYGDNLIGLKVKVWWPEDYEFYQGAIVSFDAFNKKHKVVYTDGDEEVLNLKQENWEIVGTDSVSDVEQATECRSPDPPNEISPATRQKKKRTKRNSEPSAKQRKMEDSRGEASSSKSKRAATKSGPKSRVDGKCTDDTSQSGDKTDASGAKSEYCLKKRSRKSIADISTTDEKSKDALTPKAGSKMKLGTQKTMEDTPKMGTPKTASKRKGKATKSGNKSSANGSGKVKEETLVKEEESPEMVKTPESTEWMSSKGQKTGTKGGKKRRRGGAKH